MATKVQTKSAELYEADFYVWAEEQAALLRARRFDALDLENLIEEVQGLADTNWVRCFMARAWLWSIS